MVLKLDLFMSACSDDINKLNAEKFAFLKLVRNV